MRINSIPTIINRQTYSSPQTHSPVKTNIRETTPAFCTSPENTGRLPKLLVNMMLRRRMQYSKKMMPMPDCLFRLDIMNEVGHNVELLAIRPEQNNKGTVVFYHGLGGNIYCHPKFYAMLEKNGYGALIPEYGGHGTHTGKPFYEDMKRSAAAITDEIKKRRIPQENLHIAGLCFGVIPAIEAALRNPGAQSLTLLMPVSSYQEIFYNLKPKHHFVFPKNLAQLISHFPKLTHFFDDVTGGNIKKTLPDVKMPINFVCGENDTFAPPSLMRDTAKKCSAAMRILQGEEHRFSLNMAAEFIKLLDTKA